MVVYVSCISILIFNKHNLHFSRVLNVSPVPIHLCIHVGDIECYIRYIGSRLISTWYSVLYRHKVISKDMAVST